MCSSRRSIEEDTARQWLTSLSEVQRQVAVIDKRPYGDILSRNAPRDKPLDDVGEFDNSGGNHVHSVWRDFEGDFGRDVLREHYRRSPAGHGHGQR